MIDDYLIGLIGKIGLPMAILIWLANGIIKLTTENAPAVIDQWQARSADREEHQQGIEEAQIKRDTLLALADAGSRTYTEEQLTQHLAEVYEEFGETNEFVRETVSKALVDIDSKIDQILLDMKSFEAVRGCFLEIQIQVKALHRRIDELSSEGNENQSL